MHPSTKVIASKFPSRQLALPKDKLSGAVLDPKDSNKNQEETPKLPAILHLFIAASVSLSLSSSVLAQTNHEPGQNVTQISGSSLPGPAPIKSSSNEQPIVLGEPGVIYGLQGVLVETTDGKTVATQEADALFNPASGIKLATALVALRTFGPEHRFTTGLWTDGRFEPETGTLFGNLYLSGRDPSFHYEHAVMLAKQLNSLGVQKVTGDLVVPHGFTMNYIWTARRAGAQLYQSLNSSLRSAAAARAWLDDRFLVGDHASRQVVPSLEIQGEVRIDSVSPQARLLLTHKSSQLTDILKVLLCYSNNFLAERIGEFLGGTKSVERQLLNQFGLKEGGLYLASLSGLGVNRATPKVMMKILRALGDELERHDLSLVDLLPVAGVDPGTLKDRFVDEPWRGSVVAKTGTLIRTDRGASSLIGQMRTASGEELLFVILNQRGNVLRFRANQDYLVRQIQGALGGPRAFEYKAKGLAARLADRESVLVSAIEEYEPTHQPADSP